VAVADFCAEPELDLSLALSLDRSTSAAMTAAGATSSLFGFVESLAEFPDTAMTATTAIPASAIKIHP
jgi:hypothetical protein